jgi:excisionase family DNA binding protein
MWALLEAWPMSLLLTVPQLAERLHCSRWVIYDLVKHGRLRPARLTGRLLFDEKQVESAIAGSMRPGVESRSAAAAK